ncbi:Magnesium and cobalt efflux protein CorC [Stieleria neptunia]|uniref:Magnesium and cobalt efflux protein CorC n=1 Tax=Stieleria neptunia TaxID=2527979 RepID=A0A518HW54_9BACT|nr:CBS domain-containing protein [Stieleria neptunia]QDV45078.1 Magnesium and cobalt efflux protein CorC [Stieleria neptunia]
MTAESNEYVTTECPNGHRVRGDVGWLHRDVRCPHCQATFRFDRPESTAAVVTEVSGPPPVEARSLSDTGVMRIIDSFGKPVVPEDDGRTRHCSNCGAVYPSSISVCFNCNLELGPPEDDAAGRAASAEPASGKTGKRASVEFQPVDESPFQDVTIGAVMRPRKAMIELKASHSMVETLDRIRQSPHSCYPVAEDSGDDLIGWVGVEQILSAESDAFDLSQLANPMAVMHRSRPVSDLLPILQRTKCSFVLVSEGTDTVVGMVTAKDVLLSLLK